MIEPTEAVIRKALSSDGDAIRYVKDQTEEQCLLAVKNSWGAILRYMRDPSEKVIKAAVKKDSDNLPFVKDKTLARKLGWYDGDED